MKKNIVKLGTHYFKYDRDHGIVSMMYKPSASELKSMKQDNAEWLEKYGSLLWDLDENGLCEIDQAGLLPENWDDPEARTGYLEDWEADIAAETQAYAADFVKYELPYLK